MPDEIEVPTEHLHETINEEAEKAHEGGGGGDERRALPWIPVVALSSAVMAVIAAIASLLAGHHANEGVLDQITASDRWAYYQSKSIKAAVLQTKIDLLTELQRTPKPEDATQVAKYKAEEATIEREAHELEHGSHQHMTRHAAFAKTVTLFQIAIALSAISVLARRKWLWYGGLVLSTGGLVFLVQALL
jgi:uncharacterized protein DUF4337